MGFSILKMFSVVFVAATVTVTHVTSSDGGSSEGGKYAFETFDSNGDGIVDANDIAACRDGKNKKFNNFYDSIESGKILGKLVEKMKYEQLTKVEKDNWDSLDLSEKNFYSTWRQDLQQ
ncbi:hypothetical protein LSTR_LSTR011501 [Laodelphax striatellus]|uniref:EF-hand domain-containing protein n=1 Tax=Laodelphax striatellus TaxID=195883 RepID=A0A482WFC5_LAOST|nr:hypothetical protein LSTR_LSTR011501 [Laodelphax striatellus]